MPHLHGATDSSYPVHSTVRISSQLNSAYRFDVSCHMRKDNGGDCTGTTGMKSIGQARVNWTFLHSNNNNKPPAAEGH